MPDLTIISMQQCKSLSVSFSYVGGYYQVGLGSERQWPACSCPAYKFTKPTIRWNGMFVKAPCKHITQALEERCGWHEQWSSEKQSAYEREKMLCPRCGNETEWVQVGV